MEGKTTMTLREGESQTIDFVRSAPAAHSCAEDAAIVEVGSGYKEAEAPRSILQYDVWLKHESPSGETITRRFSAMGREGADVAFAFAPMQFAVDPAAAQQPDVVLFTSVQGTLKTRTIAGSRFQIIVDTSRRDSLGSRVSGPRGSIGNSGRKMLDVAPGEAIEIELPAPGGMSSVPASGGAAAAPRAASPSPLPQQAVSIVNGRVVVNNALFFQGQRTSLIVQVKPAAQQ
jgi:hypothetical protein